MKKEEEDPNSQYPLFEPRNTIPHDHDSQNMICESSAPFGIKAKR